LLYATLAGKGNMEKIYSVSEFATFIKKYLRNIGEVVIEGEISELKVSNKWLFATVKDETASIKVFSTIHQIYNYDLLEEGTLVHLYGTPSLFEKRGEFNISARQIMPTGEGALKIAFEKLKEKLDQEGLFRPERKRPISQFPQQIGLITAKDSQAHKDFVKILSQRMGGLKIQFYPVNVQGRGSVDSIVNAVTYFNNHTPLDVLVICRGGGSLEDLQSFNDEKVVRALFSSRIPVVSGVGHEGDITLSDLVADLRASTPSNAAELIVRDRKEVLQKIYFSQTTIEKDLRALLRVSEQINSFAERLDSSIERKLQDKNDELFLYVTKMKGTIDKQISNLHLKIARFKRLFDKFENKLSLYSQEISTYANSLKKDVEGLVGKQKSKIENLEKLVVSLDYQKLLKRGFSITLTEKGKILRRIEDVANGDRITTTVENGRIPSTVVLATQK
jgi:exodeoxyribonuclease VII large subunit